MGRWIETVDYTQKIQAAQTAEEVCAELLKLTSKYGLNKLIAGTIPSPNLRPSEAKQNILLADWPSDWMRRFVAQDYVYVDPVLAHTVANPGAAFDWDLAVERSGGSPKAMAMMNEAAEHGLAKGFAVPLVTLEGDIATASFGGERMEMPPEAAGLIHLVGMFALGRAFQMQGRQDRDFEPLTGRERDVLNWVAEGKTDWEVGMILSIAESTVRSHVKAAMAKFTAPNRTALVASALRMGVIR